MPHFGHFGVRRACPHARGVEFPAGEVEERESCDRPRWPPRPPRLSRKSRSRFAPVSGAESVTDVFTLKRLARFAQTFRESHAELATLKDFAAAGFDKAAVDRAVKDGLLVELYVT